MDEVVKTATRNRVSRMEHVRAAADVPKHERNQTNATPIRLGATERHRIRATVRYLSSRLGLAGSVHRPLRTPATTSDTN